MNTTALTDTIVLGTITGMRSMAGPTALAFSQGGLLSGLAATLSAGEMIADKTSVVGDRVDAVPLMGRAIMGAMVGAVIASEADGNMLLGGGVGAATAVAAAHLAYRLRRNLPLPNLLGGVLEDALVIGIGAWYARKRSLPVSRP